MNLEARDPDAVRTGLLGDFRTQCVVHSNDHGRLSAMQQAPHRLALGRFYERVHNHIVTRSTSIANSLSDFGSDFREGRGRETQTPLLREPAPATPAASIPNPGGAAGSETS